MVIIKFYTLSVFLNMPITHVRPFLQHHSFPIFPLLPFLFPLSSHPLLYFLMAPLFCSSHLSCFPYLSSPMSSCPCCLSFFLPLLLLSPVSTIHVPPTCQSPHKHHVISLSMPCLALYPNSPCSTMPLISHRNLQPS